MAGLRARAGFKLAWPGPRAAPPRRGPPVTLRKLEFKVRVLAPSVVASHGSNPTSKLPPADSRGSSFKFINLSCGSSAATRKTAFEAFVGHAPARAERLQVLQCTIERTHGSALSHDHHRKTHARRSYVWHPPGHGRGERAEEAREEGGGRRERKRRGGRGGEYPGGEPPPRRPAPGRPAGLDMPAGRP